MAGTLLSHAHNQMEVEALWRQAAIYVVERSDALIAAPLKQVFDQWAASHRESGVKDDTLSVGGTLETLEYATGRKAIPDALSTLAAHNRSGKAPIVTVIPVDTTPDEESVAEQWNRHRLDYETPDSVSDIN